MPTATGERVEPLTVHIAVVSEAKVTGRPEDALALSVDGTPTSVCASGGKVMVWLAGLTLKLWLTLGAAL